MIFRQTKTHALLPWIFSFSIALLCTQSVKLHAHGIGHDHDQKHSHITHEVTAKHSHLSNAHLFTDISHGDHHDEPVSELDASPDGLLKKVSTSKLALALFATVLTLLFPGFYRLIFLRHRDKGVILS